MPFQVRNLSVDTFQRLNIKRQNHLVANVFEFSLPGARKFRGIISPGMKIANRIGSIIDGLIKLEKRFADGTIIPNKSVNWLGIDKNAFSKQQLQFSLLMSFEFIEAVPVSELISKTLEVAEFNLQTYREIPKFSEYVSELANFGSTPQPQKVIAMSFDNREEAGEVGFDVYMQIKDTGTFLATSVVVSKDVAIDTLEDRKKLDFKAVGEKAYWQAVYFTIGLDVSILFNTLSSRYYMAKLGMMGDRISFKDAYYNATYLRDRIDRVINTMTHVAVKNNYSVIAVSRTLLKPVVDKVASGAHAAKSYEFFCEHRQKVESRVVMNIREYSGYKA